MVVLCERIKELRNAKKMTQAELASRIYVTKSAVSAYENGSRLPSYDVLVKIARVFGVSTDHLLGRSYDSVIDATGLTREQISTIQDIVRTYQRYNVLLQKAAAGRETEGTLSPLDLPAKDGDS